MSGIAAFLAARLDEDEAAAKAVEDRSDPRPGQWVADGNQALRTYNGWVLAASVPTGSDFAPGVLAHIALHDPARTLREVEAKRKILADHPVRPIPNGTCRRCSDRDGLSWTSLDRDNPESADGPNFVDWPCFTLRELAAVYSDHPDYDESWRP